MSSVERCTILLQRKDVAVGCPANVIAFRVQPQPVMIGFCQQAHRDAALLAILELVDIGHIEATTDDVWRALGLVCDREIGERPL